MPYEKSVLEFEYSTMDKLYLSDVSACILIVDMLDTIYILIQSFLFAVHHLILGIFLNCKCICYGRCWLSEDVNIYRGRC